MDEKRLIDEEWKKIEEEKLRLQKERAKFEESVRREEIMRRKIENDEQRKRRITELRKRKKDEIRKERYELERRKEELERKKQQLEERKSRLIHPDFHKFWRTTTSAIEKNPRLIKKVEFKDNLILVYLTIINNGNSRMRNIKITDHLPKDAKDVTVITHGFVSKQEKGSLVWNIHSLPVGSKRVLHYSMVSKSNRLPIATSRWVNDEISNEFDEIEELAEIIEHGKIIRQGEERKHIVKKDKKKKTEKEEFFGSDTKNWKFTTSDKKSLIGLFKNEPQIEKTMHREGDDVLVYLTLKNNGADKIHDLLVTDILPYDAKNVEIITSNMNTHLTDDAITWSIDSINGKARRILHYRMNSSMTALPIARLQWRIV